jgi:hypothetical protein
MSFLVTSFINLDSKNNDEYITPKGPWADLDPNDFTQWWKKHHIVNPTKFINKKNQDNNIYAYFVIQDTTLSGNCWHLSYWYYNDPNRYVNTIYDWIFDKELTKLIPNDIIIIKNNYTMNFTVYDCKYAEESQKKYCKIFIRR